MFLLDLFAKILIFTLHCTEGRGAGSPTSSCRSGNMGSIYQYDVEAEIEELRDIAALKVCGMLEMFL